MPPTRTQPRVPDHIPAPPRADPSGSTMDKRAGQGDPLDIKLALDFVRSRSVYLTYSEPADNDPGDSGLTLARGRLVGDGVTNMTVRWREGPKGKGGPFGAEIACAPDGRSLFLSSGDRMHTTPSQDPDSAMARSCTCARGPAIPDQSDGPARRRARDQLGVRRAQPVRPGFRPGRAAVAGGVRALRRRTRPGGAGQEL